ncbi:MAG: hypothetical protein QGG67_20525 [Gammaproteobacteria bacterium]|jgi:hypothetical protein|nr:hypothetical protein [Gammaproteobacteria bacterium]MDP6098334.1 hypothetical protein [Gammaproteobacteria bacterium]MDP7456275.1 hypothetical protein [Gammaproteobacteria bacterium]HJO12472.1 hypothetical protein [Gammaproteobacteria bacterium]|tara:strand:+ start:177 stop:653 length:477 start_codon:yes stop_codon:yes gene_type:complete
MQELAKAVRTELQGYADRGIFQKFAVRDAGGGVVEFCFNWLAEAPFYLRLNTNKPELELKDVLPSVPFRSEMDKALRKFIVSRSDEALPDHRRLDASRFDFTCRNRQGKLSIRIGFAPHDGPAAAKTAINLLHEIFNNFLLEGPYQNYMVEVFNVPEE